MKGKVLGSHQADGTSAITAEDGNRYDFTQSEWRSDKPISAGVQVDFDIRNGMAINVYPAIKGIEASPPNTALKLSGDAKVYGRLASLCRSPLTFPLALLILVAFFLPALVTPAQRFNFFEIGRAGRMASQLNVPAQTLKKNMTQLKRQEAEINRQLQQYGAEGRADNGYYTYGDTFGDQAISIAKRQESLKKEIGRTHMFSLLMKAMMIRYVLLIGTGALIWPVWTQKTSLRITIGVGTIAIAVAALPFVFKGMMVGASAEGMATHSPEGVLSVGVGPWLMLLGGTGLILSRLGIVKTTLA